MRRSLITTILTALLALILVSAANAAVPNGQQNFLNLDAGLQPRTTWLSNQAFRLKSIYNNSLLGYGHRTFGVDLQWGDHGDWTASLPGHGGTRAITQADHVALYNSMAHKYLGYGHENFGVDLQWYDTPHFEWQLAGTGANRGLYNTAIHDYLQYGDETWGINLVWNFHEVGQDYVEPPDYQPAPPGPQVAYVTLQQALNPSAMHERYTGRLAYQTYHQAVVDQIQNTSQYPISFVGWEYLGAEPLPRTGSAAGADPVRAAAQRHDPRPAGPAPLLRHQVVRRGRWRERLSAARAGHLPLRQLAPPRAAGRGLTPSAGRRRRPGARGSARRAAARSRAGRRRSSRSRTAG